MKSICAGLGCKTLYATRGAAHFGRQRGSSHLELGKRIDRGRSFVERGTVLGAKHTDSVQENFRSVILSAVDLGLKRSAVAAGCSWANRPRRQKYEGLRRPHCLDHAS